MTRWPRYGVLAAKHAAEVRRSTPGVPVVAGTGKVFPTYADALIAAREAAATEDLVPVALRRWRKLRGLSQRQAATTLGVDRNLIARAEYRAGLLKLGSLLALLRQAGYDLIVVDNRGALLADDLKPHEVWARTGSGRNFPATSEVVRLTNEPRWMAERGQSFQSHGPQWTGERRPGQYP